MKVYLITLRAEVDDDADLPPGGIKEAIYDAGDDLPFGFDITSVTEEK